MQSEKIHLSIHRVNATQGADGEVNYAEEIHITVDDLAETNVYASPEATEILRDYQGSEIAIIELPAEEIESWGRTPQQISQDLLDRTDAYQIVITYVSERDQFGLATKSQEMTIDAYQALLASEQETAEEALFEKYTEISALTSVDSGDRPGLSSGAILGATTLGGALLATVLVTTIGYKAATASRNNETKPAKTTAPIQRPESETIKYIRSNSQEPFSRFKDYAKEHRRLGYTESATHMDSVVANLEELMRRVYRTGDKNRIKMTELEYATIVERLNKALSQEYYGDLKSNPKFWSWPEKRIEEVHTALEATNELVIENIKSHNELRDIDFRVGLESILKKLDGSDVKTMLQSSN